MAEVPASELPIAPRPKVTIKVVNFIDGEKLKADLAYSMADLTDAMMKQASMASHYADLAAMATHQVNDLKTSLEVAESKVYRNERDAAIAKGEKTPSDAYLKVLVIAHPTIIAIKRAINEAKQVSAIAHGAVNAWDHRKSTLVQLAAGERTDKQGELRIMDQSARDAILERARQRVSDQS